MYRVNPGAAYPLVPTYACRNDFIISPQLLALPLQLWLLLIGTSAVMSLSVCDMGFPYYCQ